MGPFRFKFTFIHKTVQKVSGLRNQDVTPHRQQWQENSLCSRKKPAAGPAHVGALLLMGGGAGRGRMDINHTNTLITTSYQ